MYYKVLVTNGQLRKSLAVVRTLGNKGIKTIVGDTTRFNVSAYSKYCTESVVYPSPQKKPTEFFNWLIKMLKKNKNLILFPMDDDVLKIVYEKKEFLKDLCILPLPPSESYQMACDKGISAQKALSCGIDCPDTYMPQSIKDALEYAKYIKYPTVIKPRRSSGSRGIRIASSYNEFKKLYFEISSVYELPVIQDYVHRGDRYDVCLFYDINGVLKASFVQKELRHFPVEIGPSTVQESVIMPSLVQKAVKLMENIPWRGVVEIEFMKDGLDNRIKFMEINARFWNSLYLSIISGIDFPWLLYNDATGKETDSFHTYKSGIMCKWLLPGDILHFLYDSNRFKMNPGFFQGSRNNVFDDIISRKDPFPTLGFLLSCFRYLFDIDMWKFMFKR